MDEVKKVFHEEFGQNDFCDDLFDQLNGKHLSDPEIYAFLKTKNMLKSEFTLTMTFEDVLKFFDPTITFEERLRFICRLGKKNNLKKKT